MQAAEHIRLMLCSHTRIAGGGEGRGEGGTFSAAALQRCACIMRYRGARAACAGILLADKLGARAEAETESESESGETESGGSGEAGGTNRSCSARQCRLPCISSLVLSAVLQAETG